MTTRLCISNNVESEKWNNHQRYDSTAPVFKVMGQFLGFPNLIARTHEFFETSLLYSIQRPDLMTTDNVHAFNIGDNMVCWEGQSAVLMVYVKRVGVF